MILSRSLFTDRRDAGRKLAQALTHYSAADPVVLALPRGGVPVAFEVAQALDAPLDLLFVRKIGAPGQEGARLPEDLEYREERISAEDDHARPGREAR